MVSFKATMLHFLGEVEAIFGIWVVALLVAMICCVGIDEMKSYIMGVTFTEPLFVFVIMAIASTRPILRFAETCLSFVARVGRESPAAWWLSILVIAPLLGSLITEPGAMTIAALLLARKFYPLKPSTLFAYATLGLLFVNISVGGVLTNFAAPPVLMVAGADKWLAIPCAESLAQFEPTRRAVFVPLLQRVAAGLERKAGDEHTVGLKVLSHVVNNEPTVVGFTKNHHVAGHRDGGETARQLHTRKVVNEPLHVRLLAASGAHHVGIKIDTNYFVATPLKLDADATGAATGIKQTGLSVRGNEVGLAMHIMPGGGHLLEAPVVRTDV